MQIQTSPPPPIPVNFLVPAPGKLAHLESRIEKLETCQTRKIAKKMSVNFLVPASNLVPASPSISSSPPPPSRYFPPPSFPPSSRPASLSSSDNLPLPKPSFASATGWRRSPPFASGGETPSRLVDIFQITLRYFKDNFEMMYIL